MTTLINTIANRAMYLISSKSLMINKPISDITIRALINTQKIHLFALPTASDCSYFLPLNPVRNVSIDREPIAERFSISFYRMLKEINYIMSDRHTETNKSYIFLQDTYV